MRREPRGHEASGVLIDTAGAVALPTFESIPSPRIESAMAAQRHSKHQSFSRLTGWDKRP